MTTLLRQQEAVSSLSFSLVAALILFFMSWPRHSGTVADSKAPHFFLCQLISHAIMHQAETSLGATDDRASGSSTEAGQSMTSPSTNLMKGHKCHCVWGIHAADTGRISEVVSPNSANGTEEPPTKLCRDFSKILHLFI